MKKTALTFGLFSLVMVATSFANPSTPITSSNGQLAIVPPTDGAMTGHGRKQDYRMEGVAKTQSNFANVNQSIGGKKVD